ncbi:hypothetical protein [Bifidobacterium samirii]|uniref:hypothetical protein n=1 Tax=Bifidobacterium samirii TaxID=2306974 RepID=UPI000F7DB4A5|nr:hypothetical protein [Bifidobacterium samirii]
MIDVSAWVSAGAAVVSTLMAGVTVWWPWHTRAAPDLRFERDAMPVDRDAMASLIVSCGLRRPMLVVRWRNEGDGTAYAVTVEGVDGSCDVCLFDGSGGDVRIVDSVGRLESGESFEAIILPTSTADVDRPAVRLDWKESPTRLKRGRRSTRVALPYRLPGRRPLLHQERMLARLHLERTALEYGYSYERFVSGVLGFDLDDLDPWTAPDAQSGGPEDREDWE